MGKFYVTYKIDARYIAEVEAGTIKDALKKAAKEYINADFGEACDIDGEAIIVEDENAKFVWER